MTRLKATIAESGEDLEVIGKKAQKRLAKAAARAARAAEMNRAQGGTREASGFFLPPLLQELGIHRDERRGQGPLPQEILQHVGKAQRRPPGIGEVAGPEPVGEDPVPDEAEDTAQEDARTDEERGTGHPGRVAHGAGRAPDADRTTRARTP